MSTWHRMMVVVFLVVVAGCTSGNPTQTGCAALAAGLKRDDCYQEELLRQPAAEIEQVRTIAGQIEDEMIRQAAVSRWVGDHANEVSKPDGEALCGMLGGTDQSYCLKRFFAAHLQR